MKEFRVIKDPVGGKLIVRKEDSSEAEMYLTNEELRRLYSVLGELWINRTIQADAMLHCQECINSILGHGYLTMERFPNGLDIDSYKAGYDDCLGYLYPESDEGGGKLTIEVSAHVRYWEDSDVNGEEDDPNEPKIPFKEGELWCPVIDVETGQIIDWSSGTTASISYKVCDECGIRIIGNDAVVLYEDEDYVPKFLYPKGEGYGDYILMDIDESGFIQGWDKDKVKSFLDGER